MENIRDNKFLEDILYDIWENHFCDIPRRNFVVIKFGKYSRRQLGCIQLADRNTKIKKILKKKEEEYLVQDDKSITVITISRHLQKTAIPEYVIRAVVAHELCHYAHGFSSPLEKAYSKPHRGHIIEKELRKRGLLGNQKLADEWIKDNWLDIVSNRSS